MSKHRKGFTLIELLVTLSIIGVLAALSLFALNGVREQSRDAKRKADLENIRSALEIYRADCGSYPANVDFPAAGGQLAGIGTSCNGNVYLRVMPADPSTGKIYRYNRPSNTTYELCASLEAGGTPVTCGNSDCGTNATCNYQVLSP